MKLLLAIGLILTGLAAQAETEGLGFVAPSVSARSNFSTSAQVGEILYDLTEKAFYGFDETGSWQQLSAPTNMHQESKQTTSVAYNISCTVNTFCDLSSINLTQGEWDITGQIFYSTDSAGPTGTTTIQIAVTTTSGNSTTGMETGNNNLSGTKNTSASTGDSLTISNYKVTPSATTTYYLKAYAGGSNINNLKVAYRISARKIR